MSEHFDANQIDEAKDSEQFHRTPGPALPIISLVASIAGAAIGYYINWPVGVVLVITSIVCGVLAQASCPVSLGRNDRHHHQRTLLGRLRRRGQHRDVSDAADE